MINGEDIMRSKRPGFVELIVGGFFFIYNAGSFVKDPSFSYYFPLTFLFFMIMITGIFELKAYYNKNLYLTIITVILGLMWLLSFIQPLSSVNSTVYYLEVIIVTILVLVIIKTDLFKRWDKYQKTLEHYDKVLVKNPMDITALNNKGVELFSRRKYEKAIDFFDKVLDIEPEDAAALHNKGILLDKKMKHHQGREYMDKALKFDPGLKNAKESGKMIL